MGRISGTTAAVQPARATEENPVVVPEPRPEPNQRTGVGTDDGLNPLQPRQREGGKQGEQHVDEANEAPMPMAHAADALRARLRGCTSACGGAGAGQNRHFQLIERRVAVRADVVGEQAMVVPTMPACQDVNERKFPVQPPGSLPIGRHRPFARRARHRRYVGPRRRVLVARQAGNG